MCFLRRFFLSLKRLQQKLRQRLLLLRYLGTLQLQLSRLRNRISATFRSLTYITIPLWQ